MRRRRHRYSRSRGYLQSGGRDRSISSGIRIASLFVLLVGINVYVFFFRGGQSIGDLLKASAMQREAGRGKTVGKRNGMLSTTQVTSTTHEGSHSSRASTFGRATGGSKDDRLIVRGSLKGHNGLAAALASVALPNAQINRLIHALTGKLDFRTLKAEQHFELEVDPADQRVRRFVFHRTPIERVVARSKDGKLWAEVETDKLEDRVVAVGGRVRGSLHQSLATTGETSPLIHAFVRLFSWDVNWASDPRDGDVFRILVTKKYVKGKFYKYGAIVAAEYYGQHGRRQIFRWHRADGTYGYYTPEGRSIRRPFLKTPLHFRRISSGFANRRLHPVLGRSRRHNGVDYAAATGTPVWAAADGVVAMARRNGGAGKMVMIRHAGGVVTMYMHLSRFARRLRAGQHVAQRQVVGYVGATGLATGPHLHYGIKVRGRYVKSARI